MQTGLHIDVYALMQTLQLSVLRVVRHLASLAGPEMPYVLQTDLFDDGVPSMLRIVLGQQQNQNKCKLVWLMLSGTTMARAFDQLKRMHILIYSFIKSLRPRKILNFYTK